MKYVILGIAGLVGFVVVSFAVKLVFFPVNVAQKELQTAFNAVDKTINAENAIYNYEWFKQTKEDIDATGRKLDNAYKARDNFSETAGSRETWTFEDKSEYNRLSSIALGLENHLEQIIADYNARAKMANRNIFEDSILPSYLDALTFIKK